MLAVAKNNLHEMRWQYFIGSLALIGHTFHDVRPISNYTPLYPLKVYHVFISVFRDEFDLYQIVFLEKTHWNVSFISQFGLCMFLLLISLVLICVFC